MQPTLYLAEHIKTNNFNDADVLKKFTQLWQLSSYLFNGTEPVYGVYHGYQSNYKGDYICSTATERLITDGQDWIIPPVISYKVFKTDKDSVAMTWQEIWTLEEKGDIARAYIIDYEKYYPDGSVEIYIGLK